MINVGRIKETPFSVANEHSKAHTDTFPCVWHWFKSLAADMKSLTGVKGPGDRQPVINQCTRLPGIVADAQHLYELQAFTFSCVGQQNCES